LGARRRRSVAEPLELGGPRAGKLRRHLVSLRQPGAMAALVGKLPKDVRDFVSSPDFVQG
jgi:hypothetical protein